MSIAIHCGTILKDLVLSERSIFRAAKQTIFQRLKRARWKVFTDMKAEFGEPVPRRSVSKARFLILLAHFRSASF